MTNFMYCLNNEQYCFYRFKSRGKVKSFEFDKTRAEGFLNDFKNIPQKSVSLQKLNNCAFVQRGN